MKKLNTIRLFSLAYSKNKLLSDITMVWFHLKSGSIGGGLVTYTVGVKMIKSEKSIRAVSMVEIEHMADPACSYIDQDVRLIFRVSNWGDLEQKWDLWSS